jgi:hypothetical protein
VLARFTDSADPNEGSIYLDADLVRMIRKDTQNPNGGSLIYQQDCDWPIQVKQDVDFVAKIIDDHRSKNAGSS